VFGKDIAGGRQIGTDAARMITDMAAKAGGGYRFQYSPKSFTGTELEVVHWRFPTRSLKLSIRRRIMK